MSPVTSLLKILQWLLVSLRQKPQFGSTLKSPMSSALLTPFYFANFLSYSSPLCNSNLAAFSSLLFSDTPATLLREALCAEHPLTGRPPLGGICRTYICRACDCILTGIRNNHIFSLAFWPTKFKIFITWPFGKSLLIPPSLIYATEL